MKKIERILIIVLLFTIIVWTYTAEFSKKYVVPIMMYHRVLSEEGGELKDVSVSNFDRQMTFLKKHNYNVISLEELVDAITNQKALPHNSVVITFDDGFADNYYHAFPILKRYGFPATIFIIPEIVGKGDFLTWDQIKEMEKYGIMAQSHGLNGTYMLDISEADQEKEIKRSKKVIEAKLNHQISFFCYPMGGFTPRVQEFVREAGYRGACTTNRGYGRFNRNPYALKRIRFGDRSKSAVVLWTQLSGYYNLFRKPVHPY